jgi:hypothetical protein
MNRMLALKWVTLLAFGRHSLVNPLCRHLLNMTIQRTRTRHTLNMKLVWLIFKHTKKHLTGELCTGNPQLSGGRLTMALPHSNYDVLQIIWACFVHWAWFAIILWQQHVTVGVCSDKTGWGYYQTVATDFFVPMACFVFLNYCSLLLQCYISSLLVTSVEW